MKSIALVLLVGLLAACSPKEATKEPSKDGANDATKPSAAAAKPTLTVTVAQPKAEDWPLSLDANGSVAAWQEAAVGVEVGGLKLIELLVNVGDRVKRGQLLARLSPTSIEVDIAQQRAVILEAEATLADARLNAERARTLEQTGAISAQQINQLVTAERTAEARLEAAKARLRNDQLRLDYTRVLAPDDGVIATRTGMLGAVVQPGQELFRLIRQGRLEWRAEVIASELARIAPKQAVTVEAANGAKIAGTVRMIGPTVDPQTRMALVYVDLPPGNAAKAGMFARGRFEIGASRLMSVPQGA
ncbi:MAG: efflux RND transporter periplasmic adaptor subunit, partial [Burkholderiales bacterium]